MKAAIFVVLIAAVILSAEVQPASCADVSGTVTDSQGGAVADVRIAIKNMSNNALREARSKANGHYIVSGLGPGIYTYTLDPLGTGFKGGDAVSYLGAKGLTIDWHLSANSSAIALASEGTGTMLAGDPFGFTGEEYTGIVAGSSVLIAGGVAGGLAASGEFSGSSSGPPASPSL